MCSYTKLLFSLFAGAVLFAGDSPIEMFYPKSQIYDVTTESDPSPVKRPVMVDKILVEVEKIVRLEARLQKTASCIVGDGGSYCEIDALKCVDNYKMNAGYSQAHTGVKYANKVGTSANFQMGAVSACNGTTFHIFREANTYYVSTNGTNGPWIAWDGTPISGSTTYGKCWRNEGEIVEITNIQNIPTGTPVYLCSSGISAPGGISEFKHCQTTASAGFVVSYRGWDAYHGWRFSWSATISNVVYSSSACPPNYIESGSSCVQNYTYYTYHCNEGWQGPTSAGGDCGSPNCNSATPPTNNCKKRDAQCPLSGKECIKSSVLFDYDDGYSQPHAGITYTYASKIPIEEKTEKYTSCSDASSVSALCKNSWRWSCASNMLRADGTCGHFFCPDPKKLSGQRVCWGNNGEFCADIGATIPSDATFLGACSDNDRCCYRTSSGRSIVIVPLSANGKATVSTITYTCPIGYADNGGDCIKNIDYTYYTYHCNEGWQGPTSAGGDCGSPNCNSATPPTNNCKKNQYFCSQYNCNIDNKCGYAYCASGVFPASEKYPQNESMNLVKPSKINSTVCTKNICDLVSETRFSYCGGDPVCPKGFGVVEQNGNCYKPECPPNSMLSGDGGCYRME